MTGRGSDSKIDAAPAAPKRRHGGGSRRPATARVTLRRDNREFIGWTLNISRGGVRIVLEDSIESEVEYSLVFGEEQANPRPVRVVWIKEEADGQIAGLQFLDAEGTIPPPDIPDQDT